MIGSPRNTTPATAAMTGTLNCMVAAFVAFKPGSAAYHIAYPTPDARPPEIAAYKIPAPLREAPATVTTHKAAAKGTARRKLPAVAAVGSPAPLPRKE